MYVTVRYKNGVHVVLRTHFWGVLLFEAADALPAYHCQGLEGPMMVDIRAPTCPPFHD